MEDVCLVVEGTYPYVRGGVAAWVHGLIEQLSTLRFALVHVGAGADAARELRYALPANVTRFVEIWIHDDVEDRERLRVGRRRRREAFERLRAIYEELIECKGRVAVQTLDALLEVLAGALDLESLFASPEAWDLLVALAKRALPDVAFVDLFWNARFTHLPLARLLRAPVPRAAVYHSVSTGYAGLLAAHAAKRSGGAFVLTEHGLYTRERALEIQRARWIRDDEGERPWRLDATSPFRRLWIEFFELMGRYAYANASEIIALFERNRRRQIAAGAPAERTLVVPNGIEFERFAKRRWLGPPLEAKAAPQVAFVGRVVPIKDVKTFLRAARLVADRLDPIEIEVVGPLDEDEAYVRSCRQEARLLGLEQRVRFRGPTDVAKLLETLDCLVLTSVSEGQPLVVLEAMAAGVPVVSTDVGGSRELLEGATAADRALGRAGLVTPVADAGAIAKAVLRCLRDARLRRAMTEAGTRRVERYYRRERVHALYEEIYQSYAERFLGGERLDPAADGGMFARALGGDAFETLAGMGSGRALGDDGVRHGEQTWLASASPSNA